MPNHRPQHRPPGVQTYIDRRRERARTHSSSRIYDHRWRLLRRAYLVQNPICECGCGHPATVVDHRKPHNGDAALMYDWDNLEAMTKPCHDRKTAARDGGFGNPLKPRHE